MKSFLSQYREYQFGRVIVFIFIPIILLNVYLYIFQVGMHPMDLRGFLVVTSSLLLALLFFYCMTTKVNNEKVIVSFGIGLIKKSISLERIEKVNIVKNPWYFGWGIHFIPKGILFNVTGFDGIELKLNDTDRVIRIGTENPAQLKEEILKRMRRGEEGIDTRNMNIPRSL